MPSADIGHRKQNAAQENRTNSSSTKNTGLRRRANTNTHIAAHTTNTSRQRCVHLFLYFHWCCCCRITSVKYTYYITDKQMYRAYCSLMLKSPYLRSNLVLILAAPPYSNRFPGLTSSCHTYKIHMHIKSSTACSLYKTLHVKFTFCAYNTPQRQPKL